MSAVPRLELLPHQWEILLSPAKTTFAICGVGAGKTVAGGMRAVGWLDESEPGCHGLIAANTYVQLYDSTLTGLYEVLRTLRRKVIPAELPKRSYSPTTVSIQASDGSFRDIYCRSLERVGPIAGLNIGWFWIDEAWDSDLASYEEVENRNRDLKGPRQGLVTSTADDPDSWLYDRCEGGKRLRSDYVITTPSSANTKLPADYLEHLKDIYDPLMYRRKVLAEWVVVGSGLLYYGWKRDDTTEREGNVSELAEFDPQLPVVWCHDFNIAEGAPMSSVLCHVRRGKSPTGKVRPELHAFDELILDSADTADAVRELEGRGYLDRSRVPRSGWIVCGDAAGKARDTRSKTTDYGILAGAGFRNQQIPGANPPIRERHNTVNALLCNSRGDVRLRVHPRCTTLIKGLAMGRLKPGAQYLELVTREQHVTTALGYGVCALFPLERQARRSSTLVMR